MERNHLTSLLAVIGAGLVVAVAGSAWADKTPSDTDPHAKHHISPRMAVATVEYTVPDVMLVRDDGASVSLPEEMNDGRPVMLNFIFTSCTSVCPLMSQMFSQFQERLGPDREAVHLMSISIDPEADTPSRLTAYAKRFGAGPEWQHYTGTLDASLTAQRAFDIYRGDKMSHPPVTLLRAAPGQPWRRIDGFVSPDTLIHEYHQLLAAE
jgi:protein SCO1/2